MLLRFGRGGSIALPIRATRVICSCTTVAEKQEEQIRRRRESSLRIVSIIIGGVGVIVIIAKSTKKAREAQRWKRAFFLYKHWTKNLQSIRNSHDVDSHRKNP